MIFNCFNCSQRITEGSQRLLSDSLLASHSNSLENGLQHNDGKTILDVISKVFQIDQKTNPAAFRELKSKQNSTALCEDCEVSLEIVYSAKRDFEDLCRPFSFLSNFIFKTTKPVKKEKPKSKPPPSISLQKSHAQNAQFKPAPALTPSQTQKSKDTVVSVNKPKPTSKPRARPISSMLVGIDQSNIIDTTSRVSSNQRRNSNTFDVSAAADPHIPKKINNQKELPIVSENLKNPKELVEESVYIPSAGRSKIAKITSKPKPKSKSKQESPLPSSTPAANSAPSFKINCNNCSVVFYSLDEASKHNCLNTPAAVLAPSTPSENFPVLQKPKVKVASSSKAFSKFNPRNECRNKGCNMKFDTFDKLQTHIKTHSANFLCNYCGVGSLRRADLVHKHIKKKHRGGSYLNIIEQNPASSIGQVQKESPRPRIAIALALAIDPASPTKIKEVEVEVPLHKCKYPNCPKEFESKATLLNHYKCHFQDRKVECEICGHLFLSNYTKEKHKRQVHKRINNNSSKTTTAPSKATAATKKKNTFVSKNKGGEFLCEFPGCNQSFISMYSLRGHKGYHSRNNSSLAHVQVPKIKEETEDKTREFKCQFCPNKYSSYKTKREHERKKHRFEREFAVRAKIEQEKNTSKPSTVSPTKAEFNFTTWKCELCSRNFITKSIRDNHMKNSHPDLFKARGSSTHLVSKKAPAKIISKSHVKVNDGANSTATFCKICKTKYPSPASYKRHTKTDLHKSNLAKSRSISSRSSGSKTGSNSDAEFGKKGFLPLVVLDSDEEVKKKEQIQGRRTTNSLGSLSEITEDFSKIISNVGFEVAKQTQPQPQNKCDQCDRVFILKKNLIAHEKTHISRDRDFLCGICSVAFLTHHHLDRHIKSVHSKKNGSETAAKYKCKMCTDIFDSQSDLDEHTNEKHSSESNRSSPLNLDQPESEPATEKSKFECNFCETCYPTADKLFEHFRSDLHRDTIARERENDFQD